VKAFSFPLFAPFEGREKKTKILLTHKMVFSQRNKKLVRKEKEKKKKAKATFPPQSTLREEKRKEKNEKERGEFENKNEKNQ